MAYLYVQENYKKSTEMKIKEMISYLKRAFEKIIVEQVQLHSLDHYFCEMLILGEVFICNFVRM